MIRGGSGLYFSIPDSNTTFSQQSFNARAHPRRTRSRTTGCRASSQDPTRGRTEQDYINGVYPLPAQSPRVIAHDYQMPYTWQSTIGAQGQIGRRLGHRGRLHALEGLQLRAPARSESVLQPGRPATAGTRRPPAVPTRPTASIQWLEVERPAPTTAPSRRRVEPALSQQLAGVAQLHADALHERRHHQLPVPGRQPVRPRTPSGRARRSSSATRCA